MILSSFSHPTLEGPRLRLEPLTLAHLHDFEPIAYDPANWRYMSVRITTRDELRQWFETTLQTENTQRWITLLKATGKPIGTTSFIDLNLQHRTVEIGFTFLASAHHGTGLNTEAKLLQLDYAFDTLQLRRVAFKTHHENQQSQGALRKLGATYEGTFRNHYIMPDGSQRHSAWFSITREEWPTIRQTLTTRLDQPTPNSSS